MKNIIIFTLMLLCTNCTLVGNINKNKQTITQYESIGKKIRARITYYFPEKIYGTKVAQRGVKKAVVGRTIAAHPVFAFGTKIIIPKLKNKVGCGEFIVQDRGSAVTRKKASHGKNYVFDVYVSSREEMNHLARTMPEYMEVILN